MSQQAPGNNALFYNTGIREAKKFLHPNLNPNCLQNLLPVFFVPMEVLFLFFKLNVP